MHIINDDNYQQFVTEPGMARGLVPRDLSADPLGSYQDGQAFDLTMALIPREEWPERCKEMEANKTRLSDIRNRAMNGQPFPSLDQNGQGFCHTDDTEVMTNRGWVRFQDYNWKDPLGTVSPLTNGLEFQRPFERHEYDYDGPMVYSSNRRLDFGVTPDHQMYLRKWDEAKRTLADQYSFVRAGDIGWYSGFMAAPRAQLGTEIVEAHIPNDRSYDGDDFFMLLGLVVSDGFTASYDHSGTLVSFASFRPEWRDAIRGLAHRTGFREQPSRPGVFNRWGSQGLHAWLKENAYTGGLGAENKSIPAIVKWASPRQIRIFLQWFDDRNREGTQFYSRSKQIIDDLQELHLRIGVRSSIGARPAKTVAFAANASGQICGKSSYVLTVSTTDRLCLDRKKHIEQERYKGRVYCAAVPNHTLITRRNGSVLISSNCWAYSTTAAVMLLRAKANMPYVRLSAHGVACKIFGFRDRGAWGALSLDFISKNGVPSVEAWPEKSMRREHDNDETWRDAAQYKITEGWIETGIQHPSDADMTFDMVGSCLLNASPVVCDFNWWGHSVCGMDLVDLKPNLGQQGLNDPNRWGNRILNSWRDSWGDNGTSVLQGRKGIPDGASAPRAVMVT